MDNAVDEEHRWTVYGTAVLNGKEDTGLKNGVVLGVDKGGICAKIGIIGFAVLIDEIVHSLLQILTFNEICDPEGTAEFVALRALGHDRAEARLLRHAEQDLGLIQPWLQASDLRQRWFESRLASLRRCRAKQSAEVDWLPLTECDGGEVVPPLLLLDHWA
jgi:hypothetical protein